MRINAPTKAVFWISVIAGGVGLLAHVGILSMLAAYSFWIVFVAMVLLVLGCMVKGM